MHAFGFRVFGWCLGLFRVFRVQGGRVFRIHGLEFVAFVKVSADWSLLRV